MKRGAVYLVVLVAVGLGAMTVIAEAKSDDQADIKALEERFAAAVKAKDVDGIMANYEPGEGLFVFDVIPPRQYVGWDAYKKDWQGAVGGCKGPVELELSDLSVVSDGKIAYGHNIQHFVCTGENGQKQDITLRVTDVYRKTKGKWLIAEEHISVPVDIATGKADLSSKP